MTTNNRDTRIIDTITEEPLKQYLCTTHGWSDADFAAIDWKSYTIALSRFKKSQRSTLLKYLHGWLATNNRKKKVGRCVDDKCLLCGEPETNYHVFYCEDREMSDKRSSLWREAQQKLEKYMTTEAVEAIKIGCTQDKVADGVQQSEFFVTNSDELSAYSRQFQIGWKQIYLGRMVREWNRTLIHNNGEEKEGQLARAVSILWSYGLQLWQQRNLVFHGRLIDGSTSTQHRLARLAEEVRRVLTREIDYDRQWLVSQKLLTQGNNQHSNTIAWLDSIRRIYPDYYAVARDNLNETEKFERHEVELANVKRQQLRI